MKTVLIEPLTVDSAFLADCAAPLSSGGHTFIAYDTKPEDTAQWLARIGDAEQVILANARMPIEVIEQAPRLRYINIAFTGTDHVPVEAAKAKGILVSNAAGYSDQGVAELAVGMAISLLRTVKPADAGVRQGMTGASFLGHEICGRTVGIIGTGKIGTRTAELFKAFGAKLIGYSRTESEAVMAMGLTYKSLEAVMRESDIVSLHLPLNASTRGFIGAEHFSMMKPTALFINCARGPIADSAALAEALKSGRIAGAGVDVFDGEPPLPADEPLLEAPNTLLMPHVAYYTEEAMRKRAEIVFENAVDFLEGRPVRTSV